MQPENVEHRGEFQPVLQQGRGDRDVQRHLFIDVCEPSPGRLGGRNDSEPFEGGRVDAGQGSLQTPYIDRLTLFRLNVEMHLEAAGRAASRGDDRLDAEFRLAGGDDSPQRDFDACGIQDIRPGRLGRMSVLAVGWPDAVRRRIRRSAADAVSSFGAIRADSVSSLCETEVLRSSIIAVSRATWAETSLIAASMERVSRSNSIMTMFERLNARYAKTAAAIARSRVADAVTRTSSLIGRPREMATCSSSVAAAQNTAAPPIANRIRCIDHIIPETDTKRHVPLEQVTANAQRVRQFS